MPQLPPELIELMATQMGVISRRQAVGAGLTERQVDHLARSAQWERLAPSVYGFTAYGDTWQRRLWAAVLHAGPAAAVSHEAAGRLHGFAEVPAGRVTLTVPRARNTKAMLGRWHRRDDLHADEVVLVGTLPVTSVVRTLIDLAEVTHVATLRLMVEQRIVDGVVTVESVGSALDRTRRSGRPGVTRMAEVLDRLGDGRSIPRSQLERLADEVIELAGVPPPLHEHPLPGHGAVEGFVDRCWPEARLVLELDGRRWHTRSQQMRRDADRALQAQMAGFDTVRMLWEHCRHDPRGSAITLRAIHDRRLAGVAEADGGPPGPGHDRHGPGRGGGAPGGDGAHR